MKRHIMRNGEKQQQKQKLHAHQNANLNTTEQLLGTVRYEQHFSLHKISMV